MSLPKWKARRPRAGLLLVAAGLAAAALGARACAGAEVCNLKVVTDANPDYTDIGSMIHSITANWPQVKDQCWALWYWNHIARRQTAPMIVHGQELTDPVRQFNDYGYTMCSTIAGNNCAIWGAMGLNVKFWDISLHTVPEVEYDGRFHTYDNSLSAIYTLCDGKTIAGVEQIGADGACAASGGRREPGHVAKYHCLTATGANGFLTGCDCLRSVPEEYRCFAPNALKYRYYYNSWDLGHRYVLNLRDNEVEGANVIASLTIRGAFHRRGGDDLNTVAVSTTNGLRWKEVWKNDQSGDTPAAIKLIEEVNGAYEVLVKVELLGKGAAADARLKGISFETVTMLNSKTQPGLRLGKNTVYVGAGEQAESIVLWPDLQADHYQPYVVEEQNVKTAAKHPEYMGTMFAEKGGEEALVVFRLDAPRDITRITYGGRLYNRGLKAHIDFLHSLDGGRTWTQSYSLADTTPPWDVIHYEKVENLPAGTRSVLFKYVWSAFSAGPAECSLYAVRMEANCRPADARYVRFDITPARFLSVSEVQVLDSVRYEPFDLRVALPDGKDRSDITQYPLKHVVSTPPGQPKKAEKAR